MSKSREEEYQRRVRALGREPSLAGMDDDDIEWELEKMDREQRSQPMETMLSRSYRPPDRDFAERIFKMFARPFDPKWRLPNLDGPEYSQPQRTGRPEIWPQPGRGNNPRGGRPEGQFVQFASDVGDGQGGGGEIGLTSIDPFGMFPQYGVVKSAAGGSAGGGTLDRYRSSEIVPKTAEGAQESSLSGGGN